MKKVSKRLIKLKIPKQNPKPTLKVHVVHVEKETKSPRRAYHAVVWDDIGNEYEAFGSTRNKAVENAKEIFEYFRKLRSDTN